MAVEKMKMVTVGGSLSELDKFVEVCCLETSVQCETAINHISSSMGFSTYTEENTTLDRLNTIREIAAHHEISLKYVEPVDFTDDEQTDQDFFAEISEKLTETQNQINDLKKQIAEHKSDIENLTHFKDMDIPLNEIFDCEFTKIRFGHLPKQSFNKMKLFESKHEMLFYPCSDDEENIWGVYFAPLEKAEEIDLFFASFYFERLYLPNAYDTPEKAIKDYEKKVTEKQSEIKSINQNILNFWKNKEKTCNKIYSKLLYLNTIHEIKSHVAVFNNTFCFIGWIPKAEIKGFEKNIKKVGNLGIDIDNAEDLDETFTPPTKLKTNRFSRPYTDFIEMYGVPSYNEIDPTNFLAVVYTLVFGIMFADFGQGLVLALLGAFMWFKNKSKMGGILIRCGISSAVFGFMFGSFFGNEELLHGFYNNVFGRDGPLLSPLEDVNKILILAIGIGVSLVVVAMVLNIWSNIKRKQYAMAVVSENGVAGIAAYLSGCALILKFLNSKSPKLDFINSKACFAVIIVCLLAMFFKEFFSETFDQKKKFKPESLSDFIMSNFFEVIEYVLSYFSNTLSFLRIGAYVLVHAGMMTVVYSLAPQAGIGRILVLIIGNVFVMGVEGVLTYIQVLRLAFYEMFSRFYQGDGNEFKATAVLEKN